MPRHAVVDGSNLATEGRTMPSLKQLVEAVQAYMEENPNDLITVVVDATFGHRIDPREVAEFDAAVEHNELVAPPAGAVGRGDAFVLAIAHKVRATIISNDSFQEFHAEYPWLFDEGRLIGGKPVPHVGWVFVPRVPVRGPLSRRVTRDAKRSDRPAAAAKPSKEALLPMPVPATPPPGARLPSRRGRGRAAAPAELAPVAATPAAAVAVPAEKAVKAAAHAKSTHVPTPARSAMVNELLPFLSFVENHPVASVVEGIVESYASHGAYVTLGDARGYIPLRLMASPAPRSAREMMKLGEPVALHVAAFHPQRRGIDLATPEMAFSITAPTHGDDSDEAVAKPARRGRTKATAPVAVVPAVEPAAVPGPAKRAAKKAPASPVAVVVETPAKPVGRRPAKSAPAAPAPVPASSGGRTRKPVAPKVVAETPVEPAPAPVKKSGRSVAKAAPAAPATAPSKRVAKAATSAAPTPVAPAVAPRSAKPAAKATPKVAASPAPAKAAAKPAARPTKKTAAVVAAPAAAPTPVKRARKKV